MENQSKTAVKKKSPKTIVKRAIGNEFAVTLQLFGRRVFFCEWSAPIPEKRCTWVVNAKSRSIARERLSLTADLLQRAINEGAAGETIKGFTAPDKYAQDAPVSAIWIVFPEADEYHYCYHLKVSDCHNTVFFDVTNDELHQLRDMFCEAIKLFDEEIKNSKS